MQKLEIDRDKKAPANDLVGAFLFFVDTYNRCYYLAIIPIPF